MGLDRIDALGGVDHLGAIAGGVFDEDEDGELQALVAEAAAALRAPIALVSLVLRHVQLFRAHVGLPADLAVARATDRCVSFCQFVVRDRAPFEVNDALGDARVPQLLPRTRGVRAYLGIPLWVGGQVIGSFCVLDVVPRTFTDDERRALTALAERASARLTSLSSERPEAASVLFGRASAASFGEIRNVLTALTGNLVLARIAASELSARLRAGALAEDPAGELFLEVPATVAEIQLSLGDVETTSVRLRNLVVALEELSLPTAQPSTLRDLIRSADHLAHHMTKLVGGVRIEQPEATISLGGRGGPALAALAALLSMLATRMVERSTWAGMGLRGEVVGTTIVVAVRAPIAADLLGDLVAELRSLLSARDLALRVDDGGVRLELALGSGAPSRFSSDEA